MGKIKDLDLTLFELKKLTSNGNLVTVEDLNINLPIEKQLLIRVLEYLNANKYCEKISNAYKITFDGEYFIEKNVFILKNRPFLLEYLYKKIKFTAFILNTILVLTLGILNYSINKSKNEIPNKIQNSKVNESQDNTKVLKKNFQIKK